MLFRSIVSFYGLSQWLSGKESVCNAGVAGDAALIPGSGRSPQVGNGNPLQYSCLEIPRTEDPGGLQRVGHNLATEHRDAVLYTMLFSQTTSFCHLSMTEITLGALFYKIIEWQ